jgi:hypothetical protein
MWGPASTLWTRIKWQTIINDFWHHLIVSLVNIIMDILLNLQAISYVSRLFQKHIRIWDGVPLWLERYSIFKPLLGGSNS